MIQLAFERALDDDTVPIGIESLLAMAAVDESFAETLYGRRVEAIAASGVTLSPAERLMLESPIDRRISGAITACSVTGRAGTRSCSTSTDGVGWQLDAGGSRLHRPFVRSGSRRDRSRRGFRSGTWPVAPPRGLTPP